MKNYALLSVVGVLVALVGVLVAATAFGGGTCLLHPEPFKLRSDTVRWSIKITPGGECIQGLRWSFMQVYAVWPMKKPAHGELVMAGPGFRYFAKPGFTGTDKFTLVVVGKNRHEEGYSTVEITVSPQDVPPKAAAANKPDSTPTAKLAAAETIQ